VIVGQNIAEASRRMAADRKEKPVIGFPERAHIRGHRRCQPMAKDAGGSVVLVEPHIIEGRGVLCPNYSAGL
jgi:hypothetical protein